MVAAGRWPSGAASAPRAGPRRCSGHGIRPELPCLHPGASAPEVRGVLSLEGIGEVHEEDQAEHDMLILSRVHVVAQRVGRRPELGLKADGGSNYFWWLSSPSIVSFGDEEEWRRAKRR